MTRLETSGEEAVRTAEGAEAEAVGVAGADLGVMGLLLVSVWRLAETLYGPCFHPPGGSSMIDGGGLMMGWAAPKSGRDGATGPDPTGH